MWFYIILLSATVAAQADNKCDTHYHTEFDVPDCTDTCLIGRNLDSTCGGDFKAFCDQEAGVEKFFARYWGCFSTNCPDDGDLYRVMITFKNDCEGRLNGPLTKINGNANEYLQWVLKHESTFSSSDTPTSTVQSSASITVVPASEVSSNTPSSDAGSAESMQTESAPSELPAEPSSTPPNQISSTSSQAGTPTPGVVPSSINTANVNGAASSGTMSRHIHSTSTVLAPPEPTNTEVAAPALSTTAIAGTAAGGTVGIALIIGLVFLFLRRRKRQSSLSPSANVWEPSRNNGPSPRLPNVENDSSFGRYAEVGAGTPVRQRSRAELHSEEATLPRPQTGYPRLPEMRGGGGENTRYYNSAEVPEPHRHGSNVNSRYPEMSSHAVMSMPSPTSPISQTSPMQGWHLNPSSGGPTVRLSSADLRSEGMRSPVSELGTNAPLRSTRSAELHGAGIMSPMGELSTDSFHDTGRAAAELHNEPLLPPQLDSRSKGEVPDGVVEIDNSEIHRAHRPGMSTNF